MMLRRRFRVALLRPDLFVVDQGQRCWSYSGARALATRRNAARPASRESRWVVVDEGVNS